MTSRISSKSGKRKLSSHAKDKTFTTVEHTWTIDNFDSCLSQDDDKKRSSEFPFGGVNWRMLLFRADGHNTEKHFKFELEPVIETRADLKKASEQQLREWKLFVRNGNNKALCKSATSKIIQIDCSLLAKDLYDNIKDCCLTLIFAISDLRQEEDLMDASAEKKMRASNLLAKHQKSMKELAESAAHSDLVLVSAEKEELQAHKNILSAHSRVFAAMFQANMRERNEGRVSIDDLSSSVLKKMIAFMYTGEAPDLLDTDDAIGLLEAAAKYEMDELKEFCADSMPEPTIETVCEMLALAHLHDVHKLKARAAAFIKEHADAVMETEDWRELYKTPELVRFVISQMAARK